MTTLDYTSRTRQQTARRSLVNSAVEWAFDAARALRNRRAFYHLGQLSEVELHDIGLTRADLSVPADLTLTQDPTSYLSRCARRRIDQMETYARFTA